MIHPSGINAARSLRSSTLTPRRVILDDSVAERTDSDSIRLAADGRVIIFVLRAVPRSHADSMETRLGDSPLIFVGQHLLRFRYASRVTTTAHDNNPRSCLRYAGVSRPILRVLRVLSVSSLSQFRLMHCHHTGNGTTNRHESTRMVRRCHGRSCRLAFYHSLMNNCR